MAARFIKGAMSCGLILLLAGCTGAQMKANAIASNTRQLAVDGQACIAPALNSGKYENIKLHTSFNHLNEITHEQLTDNRYISRDEFNELKAFHAEVKPCKEKFFNDYGNLFPGIKLALVKLETRGLKSNKALLERSITWGQWNQNKFSNIDQFKQETQPYFSNIQRGLQIEHQQEIAVRQ